MALFGRGEPELGFWIASSWVITLLLLVSGVFCFCRVEASLAEAI